MPDFYPLAGAVPGVDSAFILACVRGGSHIGPYIGRLMGDLILGREPELPLFDPGRFDDQPIPSSSNRKHDDEIPQLPGVIPALTTPFRQDLSLDADGFARLADCVIQDGVDGLLVNGCTGESWSLTTDERDVVFRTAVQAAAGYRWLPGAARSPPPKRSARCAKPNEPVAAT